MRAGGLSKRGVALLTSLGFVAVMAAAAVAVTETVHVGVRRAGVVEAGAQARWLALGAEAFAMETVATSVNARPGVVTRDDPWAAPQILPAPGGVIEGRIRDAANCFNLNDVLDDTPFEEGEEEPASLRFLVQLMAALDLDARDARALWEATRDWADPDGTPTGAGGREDFDYAVLDPPYRTGGGPIAHVSELRAVAGVTPDLYARLAPFLCAHPPGEATSLNVNTLTPEEAPLLIMLLGPDLTQDAARRLIESRPFAGWTTIEAFLAAPAVRETDPSDLVESRLRVASARFEARISVRTGEAFLAMTSRFTVGSAGRTSLVEREYGLPR